MDQKIKNYQEDKKWKKTKNLELQKAFWTI